MDMSSGEEIMTTAHDFQATSLDGKPVPIRPCEET
jgi:hypothetical protein